jgi:hypothetical protein
MRGLPSSSSSLTSRVVPHALLERVDSPLDRAKKLGKNRVEFEE